MLPLMMKAAVLDAVGTPFRNAEISRPRPASGQVLVRIHASGVNPLDTKIHDGAAPHAKHDPPAVLGLDMAGTVEAVGDDVDLYEVGDEVYGMVGGVGGMQGTLAEYVCADADLLAPKPGHLSMREAAALPLIAITAWEGLIDRAAVSTGATVLVLGGGGGVGHVAIQIARALGAEVHAVDGASKRDLIERLGATFIDRNNDVASRAHLDTGGRGFDLVYDAVGGATLDVAFLSVRRFGHVVSALGWGSHDLGPLSFRAATYSGIFTLLPLLTGEGRARHGEILRHVAILVENRRLMPSLDPRRFSLETVGEAYRSIRSRTARGRIVIDVGPGQRVPNQEAEFATA